MMKVNYRAEAGLYHRLWKGLSKNAPITYKRFKTAAAAIRFAIEQLPEDLLPGSSLEVEGERYDAEEMRRLYHSRDYPLKRRAGLQRGTAKIIE
jgi:hypothetical protein